MLALYPKMPKEPSSPSPTHGQNDSIAKVKERMTKDNNGQLVTDGT